MNSLSSLLLICTLTVLAVAGCVATPPAPGPAAPSTSQAIEVPAEATPLQTRVTSATAPGTTPVETATRQPAPTAAGATGQEAPTEEAKPMPTSATRAPAPGDVTWRSLAQGDQPAGPEKPALFVAADPQAAAAFLPNPLPPEAEEQLREASDQGMLIVVARRGMVSTGGYGIATQAVKVAGGAVTVLAELTDPGPDQMVTQVISYPYQVLAVARDAVPAAPGTPWKLLDADGNLLAEAVYP